MATIYRFIVESTGQAQTQNLLANNSVDANGVIIPKKGAGSKGGGSLVAHNPTGKRGGGTDHNRYMRPINPLLNRVTGGWWEKINRVGRATAQLPADINNGGLKALGGVASLIIIQFAIMEVEKLIREQIKKAKEENQANFLKIKSGQTTIGTDYKVSRDLFGKITYGKQ
jgi:DNA-directed RNA polymerase beta' subunit